MDHVQRLHAALQMVGEVVERTCMAEGGPDRLLRRLFRRLQPPHDLLNGVGLHVALQPLLFQVARQHLRFVERVRAADHDLAGGHPVRALLVVQAKRHALDELVFADRRQPCDSDSTSLSSWTVGMSSTTWAATAVSASAALPVPVSARFISLLNGGGADELR